MPEDFGTYTPYQEPSRSDQIAVGVASIVISNPRQAGLPAKVRMFRNISPAAADIITLNFGAAPAIANSGIVLRQNESVTDAQDGAYVPWQGTVTAICATANGLLAVFER
jgi:hypothetical protein